MLICVDLDGTLLDTVPANAASYRWKSWALP